jgi:V/A-type H+-transporting ATPase subunit E
MTGLDAILSRIRLEAEARAAEISEESQSALRELERQTALEADRLRVASLAQSEADIAALDRRTASSLALEARRIRLAARQHLVAEAIQGAVARLSNLPASERIALYLSFLDESAKGGETVAFTAADLTSGLAATVLEEANRRLQARRPGSTPLRFTEEPNGTKDGGGLVLSKDDIETNLTFDMIVRQNLEELEALAASLILD